MGTWFLRTPQAVLFFAQTLIVFLWGAGNAHVKETILAGHAKRTHLSWNQQQLCLYGMQGSTGTTLRSESILNIRLIANGFRSAVNMVQHEGLFQA